MCATVIETSPQFDLRLEPLSDCVKLLPAYGSGADPSGAPVLVDLTDATPAQRILGFGGAFTEASAVVYQALEPALQERVIRAYFHPEDGIGYSMGRVPINSCDFSVNPYSFDDIPEDFDLFHFDDGVSHDARTIIPMIKDAQVHSGILKLIASPWSPPAWMKHSNRMDGSSQPEGLRPECRNVWAQYIARWLTAYEKQGVAIWALTPQNEPENAPTWEACVWPADDQVKWVRDMLAPAVKVMHPLVKLFAYDHNRDHVSEWADASFAEPSIASNFDGLAFHWYAGDHFDRIAAIRRKYPDKVLLNTEATYDHKQWSSEWTLPGGEWRFGLGYAHDILGTLRAGANGWLDWNLLLDERGGPNHKRNTCDAPAMANVTAKQLHLHPQFYFIGHFSKFIPPGSVVLDAKGQPPEGPTPAPPADRPYGTCNKDDAIQSLSFQLPDGITVATVVLNCMDFPVAYGIIDSGWKMSLSIPAQSIQTVLHQRPRHYRR